MAQVQIFSFLPGPITLQIGSTVVVEDVPPGGLGHGAPSSSQVTIPTGASTIDSTFAATWRPHTNRTNLSEERPASR